MKRLEVVAAIIIKDKEILATRRAHGKLKGYWELPGGKVEDGETLEDALRREIIEELECNVKIERLFGFVEHDYPDFHLMMHCFICQIDADEIVLKVHDQMKWLTRESLFDVEWIPADIDLINKIKKQLL